MTILQILNKLDESYGLNKLYQNAVINQKMLLYRDIVIELDVCIRTGKNKAQAVKIIADKFKIDDCTVYRAINKMNEYVA